MMIPLVKSVESVQIFAPLFHVPMLVQSPPVESSVIVNGPVVVSAFESVT